MSDLKWQAPSAISRSGPRPNTKWARITAALRERPGEWALVAEDGSSGTAHYLKKKYSPEFEFTIRNSHAVAGSATIRSKVYARYVGAS